MITLCIPTMDRPEALRRLIDSAMIGTVKPDLIAIIDNNDEGYAVATTTTVEDIRKFYKPGHNIGVAASWNWFIKNTEGHKIIVNDDVVLGETTIEDMVAALEKGYEFVTSYKFCCFALSPSCVSKVGYFDEEISPNWGYFEDNDYSYRMIAKRIRGIALDTGVVHHHDTTPMDDPRYEIARKNYVKKWGGMPGHETIAAPGERIMIATPAYNGSVSVYYANSLVHTLKEIPNIAPWFLPGDAMIQRARNDLFKIAYEQHFDQLVWIDGDEAWTPEDFRKIIDDPRDFVTGLVRQKTDKVTWCVRKPDEKEETVESCGMGFCKMSRAVIEALWNASVEYRNGDSVNRSVFEVSIIDGELSSEDIAACKKWPGKIYYRSDVVIDHIGTKVYGRVNDAGREAS